MANPILVMHINNQVSPEKHQELGEKLRQRLNEEYHVLICNSELEWKKIESFNDCKGLPDVEIKKPIKDYTDGTNTV